MQNKPLLILCEQPIKVEDWLQQSFIKYPEVQNPLLRQAIALAQLIGADRDAPVSETCLQQGLYMANILCVLSVDQETLAAAILYYYTRFADLTVEDIAENLNPAVAKLIAGVKKMDALQVFSEKSERLPTRYNADNMRKMLLAMVDDVRIVLIKLAERLLVLRHMDRSSDIEKQREAKITHDIYAPLANRLGVGQFKWELEDLSFRYLEPTTYEEIRGALNSTRVEQEAYVAQVIARLKEEISSLNITGAAVTGRAKHIYSIYKKMSRKKIDFSEIYDVMAFRLLLPTVEDCYAMLGHIHSLWEPVPKEFDDYISKPKPNGYRSIHTAVVGPDNKTMEIQMRTFDMHDQAELGVAAHWIYKEGKPIKTGYEAKINWLRQVMDWQLEVTQTEKSTQQVYANVFDEHIYVFTPQGEVIELVKDATPLDFAYHIHTGLGHRCRGARVNGQMVQLTHALKMGDQVEIISAKEEHPSRDWLMPRLGYLKTSRAKSKVLHWFRVQDADQNLAQGQALLEKELRRLNIKDINDEKLAKKMHAASINELLTSLGRGETTIVAVLNAVQSLTAASKAEIQLPPTAAPTAHKSKHAGTDIQILGIGNVLTHMAVCCKPVPGDAIVGYVTQGQGVSIHREDCSNLVHMHNTEQQKARLMQVSWGEKTEQQYKVDLLIDAYDRPGIIRDVTQVLVSEHVSIISLNCITDKNEHKAHVTLSIEVSSLNPLSRMLAHMMQLPNVIDARRV
jgi:GTP pyrophosphokinase